MHKNELTLLGFDFGTKYIGIAIGQSITKTAAPLITLKAKNGVPQWNEITKLIKEWHPDALVIGIPVNMDGTKSNMSGLARAFVKKISHLTGLPVHECDERLTTHEAKNILFEAHGAKGLEKKNIDSFAAKLILESWMQQHT